MAERYQDRPFPSDDYGRGGDQHGRAESGDPLAELARLIGQTDPFAAQGRPGARTRQQRLRLPRAIRTMTTGRTITSRTM
ncbi:hypothetical protein ACVWWP_004618 [Bradyrhizobium sp. LM3.6]